MRRRIRPHLTYANVVATLALFAALGGSSYAVTKVGSKDIRNNSVRSRDIRDNDLRTRDVRNHSLLLRDFKPGQVKSGARGPRGFRGATGKTGKTGPVGLSGLALVSTDTATDSSDKGATADCPSGKRALGGGAALASGPTDKIALTRSAPTGNPPAGWRAAAIEVNGGTGDTWQLTVYAVCAKVAG